MNDMNRKSSRKIDGPQIAGPTAPASERSSPSASSNIEGNNGGADKRKAVTAEEASLTAKNYRLAKELSELRVRHRDETKNVTRLTMEHMNLTSRYREALSTITVLKKELSLSQKRTSDLLSLHKQNAEKYGIPDIASTSPSLNSEPSENIDPLFIQRNKSPIRDQPSVKIAVQESRGMNSTIPATSKETSMKPKTQSNGIQSSQQQQQSPPPPPPQQQPQQPQQSQPLQRAKSRSYEETNGTNNAFGDLNTTQFFHQNYKSSLVTTIERDATSESDMKFDDYLFKNSSSSNVDVFEASFNTSFPTSFSSTSMPTSSMDLAFDVPGFSDPFFAGSGGNSSIKPTLGRVSSQPVTPVVTNQPNKVSHIYTDSFAAKRKSFDKPVKLPQTTNDAVVDKQPNGLFPSSALTMFESLSLNETSSKSNGGKHAPFHSGIGTVQVEPTTTSPQIIESKINVAASRARFDIAKANRKDEFDKLSEIKSRSFELSPTRGDQRTSLGYKRSYVRPSDVNDEFGKLDEIVANASISNAVTKEESYIENGQRPRRAVRQPVSYAEPPLGSKIRRGDVFFQKQDGDEINRSPLRMNKSDQWK